MSAGERIIEEIIKQSMIKVYTQTEGPLDGLIFAWNTNSTEQLTALVHEIAAQMVRDTGAVEALEDLLMHGSPVPSGPLGEPVPHQANPGEAEATLAKLKAIAGEE